MLPLLEAVGAVAIRQDGTAVVKIGDEQEFFKPPVGKDIDEQMLLDLRRMLRNAGYAPS